MLVLEQRPVVSIPRASNQVSRSLFSPHQVALSWKVGFLPLELEHPLVSCSTVANVVVTVKPTSVDPMGTVLQSSALGRAVGPGDHVIKMPQSGEVRAGPGIEPHDDHLVASKPGILRQTNTGKFWIEGRQKRYVPSTDDVVLGYILDRQGDNWLVDIAGPFTALLPMLSFEGATRRNKPNLRAGDLVLARVTAAHRDMDPLLACVDAVGASGGLGLLQGGLVASVSTRLARHLLQQPTHPILEALSNSLQFDLAVGLNGRVWVSAPTTAATILIVNTIKQAEFVDQYQAETLVKRLVTQHTE